jgi:hypothetical protein
MITTDNTDLINLIAAAKEDGAAPAGAMLAQTANGLMVALDPAQLEALLGGEVAKPEWLRGTETIYVLRGCDKDLRSRNGFQWADVGGETEARDFRDERSCGAGLHGFLWGVGDYGSCPDYAKEADSRWLVVEARRDELVDLNDKVKFRRALTTFCGTQIEAANEMARINRLLGRTEAVMFSTATAGYRGTATAGYSGTATAGYSGTATAGYSGTATAGDRGTATAGYRGTATAGYSGTATAGYSGTATAGDSGTATAGYSGTATAGDSGTATAGDSGTATAGDRGTATAGDSGTATAGDRGTATAGDRGTATAGYSGTATAGDSGTATAGDSGTATAGDRGTATAGYSGTATAGEDGVIVILRWDGVAGRYRRVIGEVGQNGIKANVPYVLDESGKLIEKIAPVVAPPADAAPFVIDGGQLPSGTKVAA